MPCLTRETSKKFMDAIRDGTITPEKMLSVTSKERQAILGNIVGAENVPWVNAALESKILLKDQKRGMVSWAKNVSGITERQRRDLLSTVQKNTKVFDPATSDTFLESLAAKKMGSEITFEEAKTITEFSNKIKETREQVKDSDPINSASRVEHGMAVAMFKEYVGQVKLSAGEVSPSWYLKHPLKSIYRSAGVAKSLLSTLDNSFFGRQGLKVLFTKPSVWFRDIGLSYKDIASELGGKDAMLPVRADVFSRPNAMNGKYEAAKLDIGLGTEEAFPSHVLTRIPGLGRVAKAAETAFNAGALRMRADLMDIYIRSAERNGQDMMNPAHAEPIGRIVNSMTGRGNIGSLNKQGEHINALLFSVKFLKANFDTLTAHQLQKGITPYARRVAAANMVKIIGSVAGAMTIANILSPDSAELDPRSSTFGEIRFPGSDTTFDITGGMGSIVTLAARMVPTMHNGEWGFWTKTQKGEVKALGSGEFGNRDPLDVFYNFFRGKTAPYASILRDVWRGKDFQDRQTYVEGARPIPNVGTLINAHVPIPAQTFKESLENPDSAPLLATTILDHLGFSANTNTSREKASDRQKRQKEIEKLLND